MYSRAATRRLARVHGPDLCNGEAGRPKTSWGVQKDSKALGQIIKGIGSGTLEAKKQAFIAQAWTEDLGADTPEPMQNLARLGNAGRCAQNTFRDIRRKLHNRRNLNLDIMYMRLPVVLKKKTDLG